MEMRKAKLNFTYAGKNISAGLAPYLTGWSYTDFSHGKADDLQLTLENSTGKWIDSWFPQKGTTVTAGVEIEGKSLHFGTFSIDEIEASGQPSIITLRAMSAITTKALRNEKKTKAWENCSLEKILTEIAKVHGLSSFYSGDAVNFGRTDQRDESDLGYLKRIADENGLSLKVSEEKIIIFEGKKFDEQDSVFAFERKDLASWNFKSKSHDIFKGCKVSYRDPGGKQDLVFSFLPPATPAVGQILNVETRVESLAEAEKKARYELRKKNKDEVTGAITMPGHPGVLAGINITMDGFGVFSGKYFIDEAKHSQTAGYITDCKIRKVLTY